MGYASYLKRATCATCWLRFLKGIVCKLIAIKTCLGFQTKTWFDQLLQKLRLRTIFLCKAGSKTSPLWHKTSPTQWIVHASLQLDLLQNQKWNNLAYPSNLFKQFVCLCSKLFCHTWDESITSNHQHLKQTTYTSTTWKTVATAANTAAIGLEFVGCSLKSLGSLDLRTRWNGISHSHYLLHGTSHWNFNFRGSVTVSQSSPIPTRSIWVTATL